MPAAILLAGGGPRIVRATLSLAMVGWHMKRLIWAALAGAAAGLWNAPAVAAADAAAGLAAYNRGDFGTALRIWQQLAPGGDVQAQTGLGVLYYNGQGVVPNHGEALHWFSQAAAQGDADAQYNLAVMYAHGLGVAPDTAAARQWLEEAARQGHRQAVLDLSKRPEPPVRSAQRGRTDSAEETRQAAYDAGREAYRRGDYATAMATWQPLATAGFTAAETAVGVLFDRGLGTQADAAAATKWFRRAAISGDAAARTNLALMHLQGLGAERDDEQALTWLRRAVDQRHPRAEYVMGLMLMSGQGVDADPAAAVAMYRRAALQGVAEAQYNLAVAYDTGVGVPAKNPVTAARWYRQAALGGMAAAHYNLGVLTYNGFGVAADPVAAVAWFRMAAGFGAGTTADVAARMAETAAADLSAAELGDAALAAFELAQDIAGKSGRTIPRDIVLGVQALLVRAGFDPGPIDGVAGPRTRAALAALKPQ